jgi:hypothetical protein
VDGKAGDVIIDNSMASEGDIWFRSGVLDVIEDSKYTLLAGVNFYLAQVDAPENGVVLQLNRTAEGADFALASRGSLIIGFGGKDADGFFYAPSGSAILSYGGAINISRLSTEAAPVYDADFLDRQKGAVNMYGQIFTTVNGLAAGSVSINKEQADVVPRDAVPGLVYLQSINTFGGEAAADTVVGLSGGSVSIRGTQVNLNGLINSSGGRSLDGDTDSLGLGGNGGSISIEGTTITLARNLTATGGQGVSTLAAYGGSGGNISFTGNVKFILWNLGKQCCNRV